MTPNIFCNIAILFVFSDCGSVIVSSKCNSRTGGFLVCKFSFINRTIEQPCDNDNLDMEMPSVDIVVHQIDNATRDAGTRFFTSGVVIADTNSAKGAEAVSKLNNEFGANKAVFITTDVTKPEQLEAAFKQAISTYGTLDIVINNAGIMNDANWELQIAINVTAVVQGSLLGIKYMGKNNGGKGGIVVNLASILGLQELAGCPIYVGTKHFVVGLDRSFGTPYYYERTGIKFLTMCPGVTDTPLISEAGHFALKGFPDLGKVLAEELGALPKQPTTNVARGMITLITQGENGSVWVAEGNEPIYEVVIPERTTLRKS